MDARYPVKNRLTRACLVDDAPCVLSVSNVYGDPTTWGDYCNCPPPCNLTDYDVQWETSAFVNNVSARLEQQRAFAAANFSLVLIFNHKSRSFLAFSLFNVASIRATRRPRASASIRIMRT